MKKIIALLLSLVFCISLCACGNPAPSEETINSTDENKETAATYYTISIPSDFTLSENNSGLTTWEASDYEKSSYSITAYDVGFLTFANDTIPTTFEEWLTKEYDNEEGTACEEIFFEYKDGDKYEEYTIISKYTYTDGSTTYDLAKSAHEIEQLDLDADESNNTPYEEFPEKIEQFLGKKVIIDKADRSQAIAVVIDSNNAEDTEEFKQILASFNWK